MIVSEGEWFDDTFSFTFSDIDQELFSLFSFQFWQLNISWFIKWSDNSVWSPSAKIVEISVWKIQLIIDFVLIRFLNPQIGTNGLDIK